jgi:signal transduction histidine kinase
MYRNARACESTKMRTGTTSSNRAGRPGRSRRLVGGRIEMAGALCAPDSPLALQAELATLCQEFSLAELSALIAHELNQPLTAVSVGAAAVTRWLARGTPDIEKALKSIATVNRAIHHASRVIEQFRMLANQARPEMSLLDVNAVVEDAVTLVQWQATDQRIAMRLELTPRLPKVLGNATQLQQVVTNLVLNALQATIQAGGSAFGIVVQTGLDDDERLVLTVEDAGVGVAEEELDRLFKPFYTTKASGTGLGLSICRSIVIAHGGDLIAARNEGAGMTFRFTMPVA